MPDKKVLIVAYYWPPSGGSGVQRWLKFVKYLPQHGWKPYVFTPENPSVVIRDESLLNDVPVEAEIIKFPIWEPYETFGTLSKIFSADKQAATQSDFVVSKQSSLFSRISIWVRGNLLIPDPRKFWVRPSVRFLKDYLGKNQIKTIITTGPPHSMHLIGYKLKKINPALHWIVDMRDPWSEWGFLDSIRAGELAKAKHRRLEKKILSTADEVVTITPFYVRQFERISGRRVHLLTNGFDETDFADFKLVRDNKFLIRHVGIVNEKCDPRPFMNALQELCIEHPEVKEAMGVEFVGQVNPVFKEFVASNELLSFITTFTGNVPHKSLMSIYQSSAMAVLILTGYKDAEGYMPGKLFEYMATGLPILGVGPEGGDAAAFLKETNAGIMIDGDKTDEIKKFILERFQLWRDNKASVTTQSLAYSRKAVAGKLSELLSGKQN
jgi:glycosyltransferase involved in cell wall biosynthesis